jgi:hypothetical protein
LWWGNWWRSSRRLGLPCGTPARAIHPKPVTRTESTSAETAHEQQFDPIRDILMNSTHLTCNIDWKPSLLLSLAPLQQQTPPKESRNTQTLDVPCNQQRFIQACAVSDEGYSALLRSNRRMARSYSRWPINFRPISAARAASSRFASAIQPPKDLWDFPSLTPPACSCCSLRSLAA